jgi:hypothetical protein
MLHHVQHLLMLMILHKLAWHAFHLAVNVIHQLFVQLVWMDIFMLTLLQHVNQVAHLQVLESIEYVKHVLVLVFNALFLQQNAWHVFPYIIIMRTHSNVYPHAQLDKLQIKHQCNAWIALLLVKHVSIQLIHVYHVLMVLIWVIIYVLQLVQLVNMVQMDYVRIVKIIVQLVQVQ